MTIYPDRDHVDGFIIHLTSQELKNLQEGINAAHGATSPWSRGTVNQIQQAIDDNAEYRRKSWR